MRRTEHFALRGGENLVDPALSLAPGELLFSYNYECATRGGYRRVDGYERLDGHPSPAEAAYATLNFDAGTAAFVVGETVTGGTSAATGEVLQVTVSTGAWTGGDAAGFLVLGEVSGTFLDNESLTSVSGAATANGTQGTASTDALDATYTQLAIEARRSKISAVPGSGPVRGVWQMGSVRYAFRDNSAATACIMYKSTPTGWTAVDLGASIAFTSGSTQPVVGETLTGATSGATGIVTEVVVTSGSWGAGDAVGTVWLHTLSGTFQAETVNGSTSGTNILTCSGAQIVTSLAPGGRYEFGNYNFSGTSTGRKMYGVDGKNYAFQFDGTGFAQIVTGMAIDTPTHLAKFKGHLFLGFPGGSVQHSVAGAPMQWSVVLGAGEIGVGDDITSMNVIVGDVLALTSRNSTRLLYGTSAADWNLVTHSHESGAIEWTDQQIGTLKYLDDRGVTGLQAVRDFGDFKAATITQKIQPLVQSKKSLVTASIRVRDKNQYRLFASDGSFIIGTFDGPRVLGFTRGAYPVVVSCAESVEDENGNEILLFGATNGFVYQMDKGTSFDGNAVEHILRLPFNHSKLPYHRKRYFEVVVELESPDQITLYMTPEFSYAAADEPPPLTGTLTVESGGGFWDVSTWDAFKWSSQVVGTAETYIDGTGTNIGLMFYGSAIYDQPHILQGIILHFSVRGMRR